MMIRGLFNDTSKIMIGIERVWEEYTWTLLHQFDDSFGVGILPGLQKENARETAELAKNHYLLPALALTLGMDQLNEKISASEIWSRAQDLLKLPEYEDPEINSEFRFRLRCLFSSMGHIYSLLAMAASQSQSVHLGQLAREWFSYKRIDTNYNPR